MNKSQSGFTLVELIVVIVILGILAATALPRFINLTGDARGAAVDGTGGALNAAVGLAQGKYFAAGSSGAVTVDMNGTSVAVNAATGVPTGTAAGIGTALASTSGITIDYTAPAAVTFRPSGGSATCQVAYHGTTGVTTATKTNCD